MEITKTIEDLPPTKPVNHAMFDLYDAISWQQLFSLSMEVKWWSATKICELLLTHVFLLLASCTG